jgi:hypothetical protein
MQKALLIARKRECTELGYQAPPATWLGELVGCRCGHGIGRHSARGCRGYGGGRCRCSHHPTEILERAILEAREECELEAMRSVAWG